MGLASGRYKELLPNLFYGSHYGVGYTSGVVDRVLPDNGLVSMAYGVYLSKGFSVIYKTSYKSAVGINLSMNGYYLWDWHHKGLKPRINYLVSGEALDCTLPLVSPIILVAYKG